MTREDVAKKIRWEVIIWIAGLANTAAMLPQLYQIVKTHNVAGLSLSMFVAYFFIQVAFSLQGYFRRDSMLKWCLALSAVVSMTIICFVLHFR